MPAPLTEQWIKQQLRLCEKATKGPWVYQKHLGCKNIGPREGIRKIYGLLYTTGLSDEAADRANARLAAEAREGYPLVLKEVQRLRRVIWRAHANLRDGESGHASQTLDDDRKPGTESYYD